MYDVDYFIRKVENIPEHLFTNGWGRLYCGGIEGTCINGHCGCTYDRFLNITGTEETKALKSVMDILTIHTHYSGGVSIKENDEDMSRKGMIINDGGTMEYQQPTVKARLLAALYDAKKLLAPKHRDITKELAILPPEETADVQMKKLVV